MLVIPETEVNGTMAAVVPLTSQDKGRRRNHRMSGDKTSVALCDQVCSIDVAQRITGRLGRASHGDLEAVRTIVGHLIGRY